MTFVVISEAGTASLTQAFPPDHTCKISCSWFYPWRCRIALKESMSKWGRILETLNTKQAAKPLLGVRESECVHMCISISVGWNGFCNLPERIIIPGLKLLIQFSGEHGALLRLTRVNTARHAPRWAHSKHLLKSMYRRNRNVLSGLPGSD